MLAEAMLADLRARAARVCWWHFLSGNVLVAPSTFLAVQLVPLHRHTRAARARESANMVFANMVSMALSHAVRQSAS